MQLTNHTLSDMDLCTNFGEIFEWYIGLICHALDILHQFCLFAGLHCPTLVVSRGMIKRMHRMHSSLFLSHVIPLSKVYNWSNYGYCEGSSSG
jgi:hypothetical protein